MSVAAACTAPEEAEPPSELHLALSTLPPGGRTKVSLGTLPVELRRDGNEIVATILRCTHQGCGIRWNEAEGIYACGCHGGRFSAEGKPIAGPPRRPLLNLPVQRVGDTIILRRE